MKFWSGSSNGKDVAELKANEDYFDTDDDLKTFVHKKFGWVGPKGKEFFTVSSAGRANRRKRNNVDRTKSTQASPSVSQSVGNANLRNLLSEEATNDDELMKVSSASKKRKTNVSTKNRPSLAAGVEISSENRGGSRSKAQIKNIAASTQHDDSRVISEMSTPKVRGVENGTMKRETKLKSSVTHLNVEPEREYNDHERDLPLKAKLENCSKSLCISNTSDDILFTGLDISSNFSAAKERIISFLERCISDDIDSKHSSVLNICGRPGTGKVSILFTVRGTLVFLFYLISFL
jgi:ATP-dependent Lon protease